MYVGRTVRLLAISRCQWQRPVAVTRVKAGSYGLIPKSLICESWHDGRLLKGITLVSIDSLVAMVKCGVSRESANQNRKFLVRFRDSQIMICKSMFCESFNIWMPDLYDLPISDLQISQYELGFTNEGIRTKPRPTKPPPPPPMIIKACKFGESEPEARAMYGSPSVYGIVYESVYRAKFT
jgi:hypothetical protein